MQVHWLRDVVAQSRQAKFIETARFALGVDRSAPPAEPELRYQEVELSPQEIQELKEGRYTTDLIGARVVSLRAIPGPGPNISAVDLTRYWVLLEFPVQPRTAYRG